MSKLKTTLAKKIEEFRPRTTKLVKEFGKVIIDQVTIDQAMPSNPATNRPTFSDRSSIILRIRPTVADTSAPNSGILTENHRLLTTRLWKAR